MIGVFRAGWPSRRAKIRRVGRWWLRLGPYVIGDTAAWDKSGAP